MKTNFSRSIPINMPLVASPMDTVTEAEMAIALGASCAMLGYVFCGLQGKPKPHDDNKRKVLQATQGDGEPIS